MKSLISKKILDYIGTNFKKSRFALDQLGFNFIEVKGSKIVNSKIKLFVSNNCWCSDRSVWKKGPNIETMPLEYFLELNYEEEKYTKFLYQVF